MSSIAIANTILENVDELEIDEENYQIFVNDEEIITSDDDVKSFEEPKEFTLEERLAKVEKELLESKKREAEKDAKIDSLEESLEELWNIVMKGGNKNSTKSSSTISTPKSEFEFDEDPELSDEEGDDEDDDKDELEEKEAYEPVIFWKCDTYNDSYNMLYQKFVENPDENFKKQDLKDEWLNTNPKNKTQIDVSLKRLVEAGFIEESGKRGSKTYKLSDNEIPSARDLFEEIGKNANTAGCAKLA